MAGEIFKMNAARHVYPHDIVTKGTNYNVHSEETHNQITKKFSKMSWMSQVDHPVRNLSLSFITWV